MGTPRKSGGSEYRQAEVAWLPRANKGEELGGWKMLPLARWLAVVDVFVTENERRRGRSTNTPYHQVR